jgi:MOSC domain-containing protein
MVTTGSECVVAQIWRYPVKSMRGEQVTHTLVSERGVLGDRVWAVLDASGKIGSGKDSRRWKRMAGLLDLTAHYREEPDGGELAPPYVTGLDGHDHEVSDGSADLLVRRCTGMATARVRRDTGVSHFDRWPISLVGTATLDWLSDQLGDVPSDARRLRPNLVIRTREPFTEESWLHRPVRIGTGAAAARVVCQEILTRCVMVNMDQGELPDSPAVLRAIAARETNSMLMAVAGEVTTPGVIQVGDPLEVLPPA